MGVGFARIRATAVGSQYVGGEAFGAGFEGVTGFGGAFVAGPIRLELAARAGVLHGTPEGVVADDADIDLDGAWVGGDLRARWMF